MDYGKLRNLLTIRISERTTDDINAIVNLAYVNKLRLI